MLFTFLLVVHAIIAAALVGVILMQRSEGGGLGMGGSPSGLMSARGAADFLTRATTILATLFVAMCIGLATLASFDRDGGDIDTSRARAPTPVQGTPMPGTLPLGNAAAPPAPSTDPLAAPAGSSAPAAKVERITPPTPAPQRQPRERRAQSDPVAPAPATPTIDTRTAPPPAPAATSPASNSATPN